jgi:hypothetical protein
VKENKKGRSKEDGERKYERSAEHTLKETHQVRLRSLLKGGDGRRLETQVGLVVLGDFTHQTLEGQLADQELGALLVPPDLTESDGTGPEPVGEEGEQMKNTRRDEKNDAGKTENERIGMRRTCGAS